MAMSTLAEIFLNAFNDFLYFFLLTDHSLYSIEEQACEFEGPYYAEESQSLFSVEIITRRRALTGELRPRLLGLSGCEKADMLLSE